MALRAVRQSRTDRDRVTGPGALQQTAPNNNIVEPLSTQTAAQARENSTQFPNVPAFPYGNQTASANQAGPSQPPATQEQGSYSRSSSSSRFVLPETSPFQPSALTQGYLNRLQDLEADRPGPYQNRYEPAIQSVLDTILNRKSFNVQEDANFAQLYGQQRENYMNMANRAARDSMGNALAMTGGYGSTAAQAAGSQAYDNYLQGMNDSYDRLAQIAYQMYENENADRYNQMNTLQSLENTDWNQYRAGVDDYYRDLAYNAGRYDQNYGNDYTGWANDRNYAYQAALDQLQQENWEEQFNYNKEQDALDRQLKMQQLAASLSRGGSGGGSGRGSGSGNDTDNSSKDNTNLLETYTDVLHLYQGGYPYEDIKKAYSNAKNLYNSPAYKKANGEVFAQKADDMLEDLWKQVQSDKKNLEAEKEQAEYLRLLAERRNS